MAVAVHRVNPVQRGHVDDEAAAVLRVITIGAPQPTGDHTAAPVSTCDTALAITSGSGVDNTCATLGAVRAQPVSRWGVVSNIVTRVPPDASAQRSRKMTARWTMKLITVAVPCAITNATGTRQG